MSLIPRNFKYSFVSALACLLLFTADAHATLINPLNQLDPSGFPTNNPGRWGRGWEFTVNADEVYVEALGLNTPSTGSYDLVLWDVASQTALASASSAGGPGWRFLSVAPVLLNNGSNYIIELYGADRDEYYFDDNLPSGWYPTGVIEYQSMQFCNGCGPATFPNQTLNGYQYGVPDIGYRIGPQNAVPEPATLLLLGMGVAGLGYSRRRAV